MSSSHYTLTTFSPSSITAPVTALLNNKKSLRSKILEKLNEYDTKKGLKRSILGDPKAIVKLRSFALSLSEKKETATEVKESKEDKIPDNLELFQLGLILINEVLEAGHLSTEIFNKLKSEIFGEETLLFLRLLQEGGAVIPEYFGIFLDEKRSWGRVLPEFLNGFTALKANGLLNKENIQKIYSQRERLNYNFFSIIHLFHKANILTQDTLDRICTTCRTSHKAFILSTSINPLFLNQLLTPPNVSVVFDTGCYEIGEAMVNLNEIKLLNDDTRRMFRENPAITRYLADAINLLAKHRGLLTEMNLKLLLESKDNIKFILSILEHIDLAKILTQDNFNHVCRKHTYANSIRKIFKGLNGADGLRPSRDFSDDGSNEYRVAGNSTTYSGERVLTQPCFDLIFRSLATFKSEVETKYIGGEQKERSTVLKVRERLDLVAGIVSREKESQLIRSEIIRLMSYSTEQLRNINNACNILTAGYSFFHTAFEARIAKSSLILQNPMNASLYAHTIVALGRAGILGPDRKIHDAIFQLPINPNAIDLMSCLLEANILTPVNASILCDNIKVSSVGAALREHRANGTLTQETFNGMIKRAQMEVLCMGLHPRVGEASSVHRFFGAVEGKPIDPLGEAQLLKTIGAFL